MLSITIHKQQWNKLKLCLWDRSEGLGGVAGREYFSQTGENHPP